MSQHGWRLASESCHIVLKHVFGLVSFQLNSSPLDRLFLILGLSGFWEYLLSLFMPQPVRFFIIFGKNEFTLLFFPENFCVFFADFALVVSLLKRALEILLNLNKSSLKIANFMLELIVSSVRLSERTVRYD